MVLAINSLKLKWTSGNQPTYWPSDRRKIPDIIDFFVCKGISAQLLSTCTVNDLSFDHAPTIFKVLGQVQPSPTIQTITNRHTNWTTYQMNFEHNFTHKIKLQTTQDVEEAITYFNDCIIDAAQRATKPTKPGVNNRIHSNNTIIQDLLATKRTAKNNWQLSRSPSAKRNLNAATRNLKRALYKIKNDEIQQYLSGISYKEDTVYSLWKLTKATKKPMTIESPIRDKQGNWISDNQAKSEAFASYLETVFTSNPIINASPNFNAHIPVVIPDREIKFELIPLLEKIKSLKTNKALEHDLTTGKLIKFLPFIGKLAILYIFNALLRLKYFPQQWKLAKIIIIPKPGKDKTKVESYRPIS